jgi:uncharacterized protein (DUF1499 family)
VTAIEPLQATTRQWLELKHSLATQDKWTITLDAAAFLQAELTTPLMRFRDDVQLIYDAQTGVS